MALSGFFYRYALVRSKRLVGEKLHSRMNIEINPVNRSKIGSKFRWYGKVNQKSSRFANVPFHSHINRKGRFSSGPPSRPARFPPVHASAFHLLSPSILEKFTFPTEVSVFLLFFFLILFLDTNF